MQSSELIGAVGDNNKEEDNDEESGERRLYKGITKKTVWEREKRSRIRSISSKDADTNGNRAHPVTSFILTYRVAYLCIIYYLYLGRGVNGSRWILARLMVSYTRAIVGSWKCTSPRV